MLKFFINYNKLNSSSLKDAFATGRKGKFHIKLYKTENVKENIISNSTNNIGSTSLINITKKYRLVVSDNGLGFPEKC